jgi:hypothetical protein
MVENEVKKDLYKSKAMAKFSHYVSGIYIIKLSWLMGYINFQLQQ